MRTSNRVFQNISLPLKNARLTPALRAASTAERWFSDQYSSWPDETNTFGFVVVPVSVLPYRSVSTPAWYFTS